MGWETSVNDIRLPVSSGHLHVGVVEGVVVRPWAALQGHLYAEGGIEIVSDRCPDAVAQVADVVERVGGKAVVDERLLSVEEGFPMLVELVAHDSREAGAAIGTVCPVEVVQISTDSHG